MSDEEVICTFMSPKPELPPYWSTGWPQNRWWLLMQTDAGGMAWHPRLLDLDTLWQVEERLTDEHRWDYKDLLVEMLCNGASALIDDRTWNVIHADALTRIKALAAILRPIVEGK
jgi:hypothetical protein